MGRSSEPPWRPSEHTTVKFSAVATAVWRFPCSATSCDWGVILRGFEWSMRELWSNILVRALEVTDWGWAEPLSWMAVLHPAHAGSWGRKRGQVLDLAAIAPNIFTLACWLQCFTALFIGQEIMLLLILCPLSEANHFVVIQTWFWKQLGKIHKSPKSENSFCYFWIISPDPFISYLKCFVAVRSDLNNLKFCFPSEFKRILSLYKTARGTSQAMLIAQVLQVQGSCRHVDLCSDSQLVAVRLTWSYLSAVPAPWGREELNSCPLWGNGDLR